MDTPAAQRRVDATPSQVFAVLADGWLYPTWVAFLAEGHARV